MIDQSEIDTETAPTNHSFSKLVEELACATARTRLINLCASADVDKPGPEHWENIAPDRDGSPEILQSLCENDVLTCSNILGTGFGCERNLEILSAAYRRGALVITSMHTSKAENGGLAASADHVLQILERSLPQYRASLTAGGLPPLFLGLHNASPERRDAAGLISIHEPRLQRHFASAGQRPLAILSCYNEADVLGEVIEHWIAEGCSVHVMDNWSIDGSWPLLLAASERFGELVTLERFPWNEPASGSWQDILKRKEEIAEKHLGRWIIHTDADEIRRSPIMPFNLADSLALVEAAGWNRVDFTVLNHRPIDDRPLGPGGLVEGLPYFEFGTKPGHFIQKKAWIQGSNRAVLASSGGHVADFEGARDCPYRFLLHHYPLRSPEHARRKINQERVGRWSPEEVQRGWHGHYNDFVGSERIIWHPEQLHDSRDFFWERHGLQILLGLHDQGENGA